MLLVGLCCTEAIGATFQWGNATQNWSTAAGWLGGLSPTGTNPADILSFAGDTGTVAGTPPHYTATNDVAAAPFRLNAIQLNATDAAALATDPPIVIAGNALTFGGVNAEIVQNGAGGFTFNTALVIPNTMHFGGNGTGAVTLNRNLSGLGTIVKDGASVFRFGTFPPPPVPPATSSTAPSENSWFGPLIINGGIVRFNNNADSGRTAIRGNPVTMSTGTTLNCTSELRLGTISGTGGTVESQVVALNANSDDVVISAFGSATFGGTLRLGAPTGTGNDVGTVVVRGPGTQTLTGTLAISKDIAVGGNLVIGGTASLSAQTTGAIVMNGGTFRLDNATVNNNNRLRDGDSLSTGLETIGGGLFQLSGNVAGTSETIGRLQLGTLTSVGASKPRSGHLSLQEIHRAGATAATVLNIAGYSRDASVTPVMDTVEFSALDGSGAVLALGSAGSNPRIVFSLAPTVSNSLLSTTVGTANVGWATVQTATGIAFATHGANGIAPVATVALTNVTGATLNSSLTTAFSITIASHARNSLRILPSAAGQTLTLSAGTTFNTTAIALAGATDFTITGGTLGGGGPRFLTVEKATLNFGSALGSTQMLVKTGAGALALTNVANNAGIQATVINNGALLATPGTTLPGGELRFRGGVLGIVGGGTFSRPFLINNAPGTGTVNWSGLEFVATPSPGSSNTLPEDRGSGGFAAINADASVDLGVAGVSNLLWEQKGFVQSSSALVLGSPLAGARLTLIDNLSLSSGESNINYNAREIRVPDNTTTTLDRAIISGIVSGTTHNDFLKTGNGTLELTAANTFAGAAIVESGTLVITGSTSAAIVTDVMSGATLAGSGSTGPILVESGGSISPGDNSTATLTATGLTWRAGGIAKYTLGTGGASDRIALGSGPLEKGSTSGTYTFNFGGTGAMNETYTLATFGSTTFLASDFTATSLTAGVTGQFIVSGSSVVFSTVPPSPFGTWRTTYFGAGAGNSGNSADSADPDSDGLSNLAEYVLGGNPIIASRGVSPAYTLPGGVATFAFTRNPSATDVALRIEARNSLSTGIWQTIATRAIGASSWTSDAGVGVSDSGNVIITDSATPSSQPQRFLRLAVDHP